MTKIIFQTGKELEISASKLDPIPLFGSCELVTITTDRGDKVSMRPKDVLCLIVASDLRRTE